MKSFKKLFAIGFATAVLLTSTGAFAGTLGPETLTGTSAKSSEVYLGSGTHKLVAKGISGTGVATVKKIRVLWPDQNVKSVDVTAPYTSTAEFNAEATNGGVNQSYYVLWNGSTSSAKAQVSIVHP
ncbi:hypothetical protein [Ureibacillus thermosphaericus]|uniref:hypothetical protein n=1 Tax=Ureibacillus TaxID=160795 RepID=UPI000BBC405D|nr:hypothetical protein [Ureibacillus thermosphaericus]